MKSIPEFQKLTPHIATWSVYCDKARTSLHAHAHVFQDNLALIDPVLPKSSSVWHKIMQMGNPNLIVLTNGNHERDSKRIAEEYKIPIAASAPASKSLSRKPDIILDDRVQMQGLKPIYCPGGGPGESALFSESTRCLFLGDAIVNLPDTGLQLLPEKYCEDTKQNTRSLRQLLNLDFKLVLVAHGVPLSESPKTQLKKLLS
ncbi:MAG: hypothetical protein AAF558_02945 [Verrucomicrobiota bacterium]